MTDSFTRSKSGLLIPSQQSSLLQSSGLSSVMREDSSFKIREYRNKSNGIWFDCIEFVGLYPPDGWLDHDPACHALFHYCFHAIGVHHTTDQRGQLEGSTDHILHFGVLLKSFAMRYNVDINKMANYWDLVDLTWKVISGNDHQIPDAVRYGLDHINLDNGYK